MTSPRATVRLQLHAGFTLDDAAAQVDYYASLGISHFYCSPMLTARPGSMHGYDIVDPTRINPELGGEAALHRLVRRLRDAGMGLVADIVPNHMGVGDGHNPWWQHVLEWGRHSPYAGWFDIDWDSPDPALRGKVMLPFLGQPYAEILESGELALRFDDRHGTLYLQYHDHRFPLSAASYAMVLESASKSLALMFSGIESGEGDAERRHRQACALLREFAAAPGGAATIENILQRFEPDPERGPLRLHRLLERQHYRLTWWRNAAEEINWRRFFEISELAGIRVELPAVFDATHGLILRLYEQGLIDGVRIDHVDGLADPAGYCRRLRERLVALTPHRPPGLAATPPWIVVEKILAPGEHLRTEWEVDGTTGYDFMELAGALLHDANGAEPLAALWQELTGDTEDYHQHALAARRQILGEHLVGEFEALARALHAVARSELATRDIALPAIRRVLTELLVATPVYRTYATAVGRDAADQQVIDSAVQAALAVLRPADQPLLTTMAQWLGAEAPDDPEFAQSRSLRLHAITRFQQLTPPLAAKALEDTAFYRYGRLLSRNEVGAEPGQFSLSTDEFHRASQERLRNFPDSLLATATHDHKRGEDVRARLAVLSEVPDDWASAVRRWTCDHAPFHSLPTECSETEPALPSAPQPADEIMLYQMLLGAWPPTLMPDDADGLKDYVARIAAWQEKALREAKRHSGWSAPAQLYEQGCHDFLQAVMAHQEFVQELRGWADRLRAPTIANSLLQTVLRLTAPGIPDLYQGTEFDDYSLVDPDNRRPVDYAARRSALETGESIPLNARHPHLKQHVIHVLLELRQREAALFRRGDYVVLEAEGALAAHVVAYARQLDGHYVLVAGLRCCAGLLDAELTPRDRQDGTRLMLPPSLAVRWQDEMSAGEISAREIDGSSGSIALCDLFARLPVAVLTWSA